MASSSLHCPRSEPSLEAEVYSKAADPSTQIVLERGTDSALDIRSSSWPHRQPCSSHRAMRFTILNIMHMYNFEQMKVAFLESKGVIQISQPSAFTQQKKLVTWTPSFSSWPLPVLSEPPGPRLLLLSASRAWAEAGSVHSSAFLERLG